MNPGRTIIDRVMANPIPAALAGIGLLLMLRDTSRGGNEDMQEIDDVGYDASYGQDDDAAGTQAATGRLDGVRDRVSGVMSAVGERASGGIQRVRSSGESLMESNPLIMGVAAIAFGALVGALIPESEREHRLFGEHRDQLLDRGRDLARQSVDRAKSTAVDLVDRVVTGGGAGDNDEVRS